MSPRRHHFRRGHHFRWDCPLNGSQLNCHKRSGTGKFSYSSVSAPRRHQFSWGHTFKWGHSCIASLLNCHKGSYLAIPVPLLFWPLLPVPCTVGAGRVCNQGDYPVCFYPVAKVYLCNPIFILNSLWRHLIASQTGELLSR